MSQPCGQGAVGSSQASGKGEASTNRGPFLHFMMLMGKTAGLSQKAGAWTADSLVASGRSVGKLLKAPANLWPSSRRRAKKRSLAESPPQLAVTQTQEQASPADSKNVWAQVEDATARVASLEADLASATGALEEARLGAEEARTELSSQVGALESEQESLLSDLNDAQTEAEHARAEADALEADLTSVRSALEEARNQTLAAKVKDSAKVNALQSEKESLLSDLRDARAEAEHAVSRIEDLDEELSNLRESLKSALDECQELRDALEYERSLQRASAEVEDSISGESTLYLEDYIDVLLKEPDDGVEPDESVPQTDKGELHAPPMVTAEQAHVAVFSGAAERVLFTRALSNLESDDVSARAAAAKAMGAIPHELSVRALMARFSRETSAEVRQECLCALTALDAAEAIPVAQVALEDEAASVRLAAVRAIYRLVGLEGADALTRVLNDKDEDVRRRTVTCLGWLGHQPLAFKLVSLLKDTSASVRLATLEALANLRSPAVVDEIMERLDDPEESVQRATFQALETITGKKMGDTFPQVGGGRDLLIARWRAWREKDRSAPPKATMAAAFA